MSLSFELRSNPNPRSTNERQAILADPGFGIHFTDHMAVATWTSADGWHDSAIVPYGPFSLDPATAVLHYAQEVFEGLKAYRHADGSVWLFRPDRNAARMGRSARRLALPVLEADDFLASIDALVCADASLGAECAGAEPVPAALHVRLRGLPRGPAGEAGDLLLHRQSGRAVLLLGRAAGQDLDLHHLHPSRVRWDRRGQVRRQLCGQPGRAAGGGRRMAATR